MSEPEAGASAVHPNPLLAFIHVPKTAGTTIQAVLEGAMMNDRPAFNIAHPDQAQAFLALSKPEQDNVYAVFGHMPFGVDRYVDRPVTYVTFLRDPIERTLSAYAHSLRHPDEPGSDTVREMGLAWTALPSHVTTARLADYDFAERPDAEGRHWLTNLKGDPLDHLAQAKANLDRSALIGLHETYAADVRALGDLVGRRILIPSVLPREKAGDNRIRQSDLTAEQVAAIRQASQLDYDLYAYAQGLRETWGGPINPAYRRQETWTPLALKWWEAGRGGVEEDRPLPDVFSTPQDPWFYGAISDVLPLSEQSTLRVRARSLKGVTGLCLLSDDAGEVLSEQRMLNPAAGEETVFLTFKGSRPAKLCIRNYDSGGHPGQVELLSVEATPAVVSPKG